MKSISLLTYTKNEDEVDDKCEGFKKVSIEIIQGYEYTSSGNVCKNKCKIRKNFGMACTTRDDNYEPCVPCKDRGTFC